MDRTTIRTIWRSLGGAPPGRDVPFRSNAVVKLTPADLDALRGVGVHVRPHEVSGRSFSVSEVRVINRGRARRGVPLIGGGTARRECSYRTTPRRSADRGASPADLRTFGYRGPSSLGAALAGEREWDELNAAGFFRGPGPGRMTKDEFIAARVRRES